MHLDRVAQVDDALDHAGDAVLAGRVLRLQVHPLGPDHDLGVARGTSVVAAASANSSKSPSMTLQRPSDCRRAASASIRLETPRKSATKVVVGCLVDLLRRADLLDPAVVHHGDPVAHGERLLLVVGDVHERDPDLLLQRLQLDLQRLSQLRIQRAERLVQQQHRRLQHSARASATRCCWPPDICPGLRFSKPVSCTSSSASATRWRISCLADPLAAQAEGDVVVHVQVREQRVVLEHGVDVAPVRRREGHVVAVEQDLALGRLLEARRSSAAWSSCRSRTGPASRRTRRSASPG